MKVITGDVSDVLPLEGYDACLCDPPYGLSFMGKDWDHGVPSSEIWRKVYDSLKPGAMLMAFGGTRTHHRLMVAIEDAGFEIRDCLMWLYGSGFPKSHDISKAIDKAAGAERDVVGQKLTSYDGHTRRPNKGDKGLSMYGEWSHNGFGSPVTAPATDLAHTWGGYGTALKPAWEPIVLAMKPCDGTFASNAEQHGVAGLNIDGGRIAVPDGDEWDVPQPAFNSPTGQVYGFKSGHGRTSEHSTPAPAGRWPANLLLDEASAGLLDAQSGELEYNPPGVIRRSNHCGSSGVIYSDGLGAVKAGTEVIRYPDSGGASRFFYCAKASRSEREAGLSEFNGRIKEVMGKGIKNKRGNDPLTQRWRTVARNHHPTVKPLDLCRYLATLILPPEPGKLLVPFCGSGSEMIGAYMAGWRDVTGIELNDEYAEIARARIAHHTAQQRMAI